MEESVTDWKQWSLNNTDMSVASEDSHDGARADDSDGCNDFEVQRASSGESEDSEEELVEVRQGENTLYFRKKDDMAQCQFCGSYGVRESFFSQEFCTSECQHKYRVAMQEKKPTPKQLGETPISIKPYSKRKRTKPKKVKGFDWVDYFKGYPEAVCAQVKCFQHVPLADSWEVMNTGMKLEIMNSEAFLPTDVYWIASVIKLAGYKALLRYEGYGDNSKKDFWINLMCYETHPVGWCAANVKPLVPPREIQESYGDWKEFLVKRLTGSSTLPHNFHSSLNAQLKDCQLKRGMYVEVVDKLCLSATRVATIQQIIGTRVKVKYVNCPEDYPDDLFHCDFCSPLLHPVGWSQFVGHRINASAEYKSQSLTKITLTQYEPNDATPQFFPAVMDMNIAAGELSFQVGMKLEAIDPLNLSAICVATVTKVLKNNYLMIGIDGSGPGDGSDSFCYHATSPCILPVGFCEVNNLELTPPRNHRGPFKWIEYLKQQKAQAAPVKLFPQDHVHHGFRPGMKLEAADLMDPRLVCVATVVNVLGRLLRIHFDGWEDSYDQWVDCHSPDIYPSGWCEMVGFPLEGPKRDEEPSPKPAKVAKKRKSKNSTKSKN